MDCFWVVGIKYGWMDLGGGHWAGGWVMDGRTDGWREIERQKDSVSF